MAQPPLPAATDRSLPERDRRFARTKRELHERLVNALNVSAVGAMTDEQLRLEVRRGAEELCRYSSELSNAVERERLVQEIMDEAFGLGPLEPLMKDPTIADIVINGPHTVYVERYGRLELTGVRFDDDRHLRQVVRTRPTDHVIDV